MKNRQKVEMSLYRQIAIDIAEGIANGKYARGEKLYGRSVLASHYKVSPETIRKAVYLLKDVGILKTEKGSGIEVVSVEKAEDFVNLYGTVRSMSTIKKEIGQWAKDQAAQTADILNKVQYLIDEAERINTVGLLNPFQVRITEECTVIGKSVDELKFWHKTGGTIVAIRRGESLILSPGPYASFCVGDCFFVIGDETTHAAVVQLLFE